MVMVVVIVVKGVAAVMRMVKMVWVVVVRAVVAVLVMVVIVVVRETDYMFLVSCTMTCFATPCIPGTCFISTLPASSVRLRHDSDSRSSGSRGRSKSRNVTSIDNVKEKVKQNKGLIKNR